MKALWVILKWKVAAAICQAAIEVVSQADHGGGISLTPLVPIPEHYNYSDPLNGVHERRELVFGYSFRPPPADVIVLPLDYRRRLLGGVFTIRDTSELRTSNPKVDANFCGVGSVFPFVGEMHGPDDMPAPIGLDAGRVQFGLGGSLKARDKRPLFRLSNAQFASSSTSQSGATISLPSHGGSKILSGGFQPGDIFRLLGSGIFQRDGSNGQIMSVNAAGAHLAPLQESRADLAETNKDKGAGQDSYGARPFDHISVKFCLGVFYLLIALCLCCLSSWCFVFWNGWRCWRLIFAGGFAVAIFFIVQSAPLLGR